MSSMNWRTDFGFDEGTIRILEISCALIKKYFGHQIPDVLVYKYFQEFGESTAEDYVGHTMSWHMAAEIYFTIALGGARADLRKWQSDNGWLRAPDEAIKYIEENYWNWTGGDLKGEP